MKNSTKMTLAAALMLGGMGLASTPAMASCNPGEACTPPPPPPPPPPVVDPTPVPPSVNPPINVTTNVTSNPTATAGASAASAAESNATATGGNATGGSVNGVSTGNQSVNVQGSTTTYRQVRQAPGAYAPTVIAPTAVGRCHETSGGPAGGISTPFGGISFGGRTRAIINGQCEGHVQSIENRADGRLAADSIEGVDPVSACFARVDAMDANPVISDTTVARARAACETPAEEAPAARRMTRSAAPAVEANVPMEPQNDLPLWTNPSSCPAGYSLRDVSSRAFTNDNGQTVIEMPNSTGGTTTFRVNYGAQACVRG